MAPVSDLLAQLMILVLGPTAIVLANSEYRKWGPVVGLMSQPFWFWTTLVHHQWPVFCVSFIYTAAWARGFYNLWLRR
jgi:hypothetical protein